MRGTSFISNEANLMLEKDHLRSMQREIKAILFDVGGTLRTAVRHSNTLRSNLVQILELAKIAGSPEEWAGEIKQRERAYYRWATLSMIELNEVELWGKWLLPEADPERVKSNAILLNKLWRDARSQKLPLSDMADTLKELARRGYKLGIISNTTSTIEASAMLAEEGISDLMDTVILSSKHGRRKPHPSLFLQAARDLGVDPGQAAYVGDRPSRDVVGAREAGYREIVIIQLKGRDPEIEQTPQLPDHRITQLSELLDIFPLVRSAGFQEITTRSLLKYDCSISSMWAFGNFPQFNDFFTVSRKMGIARFELNHQIKPELMDEIDFNTHHINSLHEPCPAYIPMSEMDRNDWLISSLDEDRRTIAVNSVKHTIDMAVQLGCRYVVVHPGGTRIDRAMESQYRLFFNAGKLDSPESVMLREKMISARNKEKDAHLAATVTSLQEIGPYAFKAGIAIALENRYHYYDIPLLDEMQILLDLFDDAGWGFNYDVGHAQALDRLGFFKHEDWLTRYGGRMIATHLHDVVGITDHQVPGIGDIDFRWVASYLPASVYRTLEVNPKYRAEEIIQGLEHLVTAGCIKEFTA
jgi:HAD superfamily hydrolase (TIGR01662 family)